jgi:hypothetical protein
LKKRSSQAQEFVQNPPTLRQANSFGIDGTLAFGATDVVNEGDVNGSEAVLFIGTIVVPSVVGFSVVVDSGGIMERGMQHLDDI